MPRSIAVFGLMVGLTFNLSLASGQKSDFYEASDFESVNIIRVASGICPQNRKTRTAPGGYLRKTNPLLPTKENIQKGRNLFVKDTKPTACKLCHGTVSYTHLTLPTSDLV